jgi:hypothetical protein
MPYKVEPYANGVNIVVGQTVMFYDGVTPEIMEVAKAIYDGGAKIQDAFPFLTTYEREFLMSGLTPEAWAKFFPPEV